MAVLSNYPIATLSDWFKNFSRPLSKLNGIATNLDGFVARFAAAVIRDFTIYDAVVNENASKQQYHWLKEEK